ncbi:MAG: cyclic nucleotide-binding domain-containing protein [Treponema sp.]|jgi:Na+/H+ antiporter NhaC|nr:cyclic nucleotide-binding domain-containing protein [Treponema sp.]
MELINRDYIQDFFRLKSSEGELLDFIMSRLVLKEYSHNSFICRAGDSAEAMYFIESGTVSVLDENGDAINEMNPGRYFGEYAALTGDKRMADIQAKGTIQVYELDKKSLHAIVRNNEGIYGLFLKNAYGQATEKYRKLVRLLNTKRGIGSEGTGKKLTLPRLFFNYYIVFFIFLNVMLFAPNPAGGPLHPLWLCSPVVFMVAYMIITKRALEALVLSAMYTMILLARFNFIKAFYEYTLETIGGAADIILMVALMGSLTRIFSASGSINALRHIARRKIKSARGTLFAAFFSMILIAIDEYLSILINGACFMPLADEKRIPREKSAMVMGMSPGALCILSPISLTGIYLSGMILISGGQGELFLRTAPYNFSALFFIVFIFLLASGKLPLVGALKKAVIRVKEGGPLWPEGTDDDMNNDDDAANRGRVVNLLLPVLVLIFSSILTGSLGEGKFHVNVLYGMVITLIFAFLLYCFQRYLTPEQFFKNMVYGIEGMMAPIVMFLVGKCFAVGMEKIGFSSWLNEVVQLAIQGQVWLLPVIIFSVCTFVGALFDNPWAMYAIGMPIALNFSASLGQNQALYAGAVCAAGLVGNELAMGDIFFIGPMLGINPTAYYRTKLPYVIVLGALTFIAYTAAGYFGL